MTIVVVGFHGTSADAAQAIEREGFRPSRKAYDWLGDGIYFFQDAPVRAWEWASVVKGHADHAAVLGVEIRLDNCLDLLDTTGAARVRAAYRQLLREYRRQGRRLPPQRGLAHRRDRLVMNSLVDSLAREGVRIRVVRAAFREGKPLFPGSALYDLSHVQIAVRDPGLLSRLWRER